MNSDVVVAEGIAKSYGNFKALRGVNLRVKKGEFLSLFGPNGSGKTTFIKILSALAKPTSGKLTLMGRDIQRDADFARAAVGVISHDPYLYANLSALENILFFASLYGVSLAEDSAARLIAQVGLQARMHDLVRTFSRGMKQRLAVARSIVHNPALLLLDEPYTGLDPHGERMFTDILAGLKSEGRTIIMTTHNVAEGFRISDRAAIMARGEVVFESPAEGLDLERFKGIYFEKTALA
ncbi:MAG: ABC transporter ATP-binding protein [Deltaproteobacteria bacterium]